MNKIGARIILLVLLLITCIPLGMYFIGGGGDSVGSQTEISDLTVPDEDPNVSEDEAMDVILEMIPGSDYGDIVEFSQTYDEGGWIYEGKIQGDKNLYQYQVDGENGNILKWIVVKK